MDWDQEHTKEHTRHNSILSKEGVKWVLKIQGETEGSSAMHQILDGGIEERQWGINMDNLDKAKDLYYIDVYMQVEI